MSNHITKSILLVIDVINTSSQALCCYLLVTLYHRTAHTKRHHLYLINLAASEFFANLVLMVRDSINLHNSVHIEHRDGTAFWCVNMFFVTGVCYIYILAMFYLTADRLGRVIFNIRYEVYWSPGKVKRLLIFTWVVNIVISILFALLTYFKFEKVRIETKISRIMTVYVLSSWYAVFLLFAAFTYLAMFLKYAISRRTFRVNKTSGPNVTHLRKVSGNTTSNNESNSSNSNGGRKAKHQSLMKIFINSRFFILVLLIFSYLVLTVLPSLTRSALYLAGEEVSYSVTYWYLISVRLSYSMDAVIYTFLEKRVRALLCTMIRSWVYAIKSRLK